LRGIFEEIERWPILVLTLVGLMFLTFTLQSIEVISAKDFGFIPTEAAARPWTPLTSLFVHASPGHLVFNVWFLLILGYHVEAGTGRGGLLGSFLLAGLVSTLGAILLYPGSIVVGASGAILGVAGFLAVVDPFRPVRIFIAYWAAAELAAVYGVLDFILMFASEEPIAYGGHLLGLIIGIVLGLLWRRLTREE
jgi:hypothetical protein